MMSDVLLVNSEQEVVLFESFSEKVEINLYNPLLKTITSS